MEQLQIDTGVREFRVNERGILRFNPADPNVYGRFLKAAEEISVLHRELEGQDADQTKTPAWVLDQLTQADRKAKEILTGVFGPENDFDRLLEGVNLMAVAGNGQRVVTNLFAALEPVMAEGAMAFAKVFEE